MGQIQKVLRLFAYPSKVRVLSLQILDFENSFLVHIIADVIADPEEELERDPEMEPELEPDSEIKAMPDEILLKIFSLLHFVNLGNTAQVSKRWKKLSQDEFLWSKINVSSKAVPAEFIGKCLKNGCKYLNLDGSHLLGEMNVPTRTKLKYLRVSGNYLGDAGNYDEWMDEINQESYEVSK